MSDTSKDEIVAYLKEFLGLPDVKFEKLSKSDLRQLYAVVTNLGNLAQMGVKSLKNRVQSKIDKNILDRPLREIIHSKIGLGDENSNGPLGFGLFAGAKSSSGPLGLGVLSGIRRELVGSESTKVETEESS